ncbi:hypothetical protein [Pseudoalteromonas sp. MSK9-3]|uniref:hypothetical protein n=1 Tax=Pseudoalteromonas sp. MSK9-3 TaxID=1897633 RepID=UPI0011C3D3ED|nr:hypothetical protein [Pseudoalteromonas sp. MSK9-3]
MKRMTQRRRHIWFFMYSQQHRCTPDSVTDTENSPPAQSVKNTGKKHHTEPTKSAAVVTKIKKRNVQSTAPYCGETA